MKKKQTIFRMKNLIALTLVASFLVSLPYAAEQVWATSASSQKKEAEDNLEDVEKEIEDIEAQKDEVDEQLDEVRAELNSLIAQQNALQAEIAETEVTIEQTSLELEQAKADADAQYEAMKIRIQYMYENSTSDNLLTAILQADGITDMLNRMEYITTIHEADRDLTEEYKQTVAVVEEKEQQLLVKMDELLAKEETFLGQQAEIQAMIADLEEAQDEFSTQLAAAEAQAEEYRETIEKQSAIIQQQQQQQQQTQSGNTDYVVSGNVTGQDIVNYAMQFVGNPYVWGGNSLTNGCDCSGFVHLVYKHFGYKTVRYSMSFAYEGVAVSREDVQPGDIVVYAKKNGIGHVAIYAGNGKIVEAQSAATGITAYRSIDCREIVAIRRIIQ